MANEIYVNVNGTWKQASAYYVNVNGTWKTGSEFQVKVSSNWKGGTVVGSGGLPSVADILTLDILDWSLPGIGNLDTKSAVGSESLDVLDWSLPVVGLQSSS
jgi:hypothetical protein